MGGSGLVAFEQNSLGTFNGYKVMRINSIPHRSLLDPSNSRGMTSLVLEHKNNFLKLLNQVHQKYLVTLNTPYSHNICLEIVWKTTEAEGQPFLANVDYFVVIYATGDTVPLLESTLDSYSNIFETFLDLCHYEHEYVSPDDYPESGYEGDKTVCFITKQESIEGITSIYDYDRIPVSESSLEQLIRAASNNPNVVIRVQLIPTVYTSKESINIANNFQIVTQAQQGSRGTVYSAPNHLIDGFIEKYRYYYDNRNGALFTYGLIVEGPKLAVGNLSDSMAGHLRGNGIHTLRLREDYSLSYDNYMSWGRSFIPWAILDYAERNGRPSIFNVYQRDIVQTEEYYRLPFIITSEEASEIFRLPLGDSGIPGITLNEVNSLSRKFRCGVVNTGDIVIGKLKAHQNGSLCLNLSDFCKHTFICGTPGSGKTTFGISLLDRLWKEFHIPFLVIEPTKTEYRAMISSIPELQVFTVCKDDVLPFIMNPFVPPHNVKLSIYKSTLKTAFAAGVSMSSPLDKIFEDAVNNCYSDHGWLDSYTIDDNGTVFNMTEFIKCFQETFSRIGYVGDSSNIGKAGTVRLKSLQSLFDNYNTIPIEDLLSRPTIIELNAVEDSEQKNLIMALILLMVRSYVNNNVKGDGKLKNILMLEEAHVLLDQDDSKNKDSNPSSIAQGLVKRILAETRSYGLGMIIADQSPRKVGQDIIALTDVKVFFRLVESTDCEMAGNSMGFDEASKKTMIRMKPGEAFAFYNRMEVPERIVIPDYRFANNIDIWISDDEIRSRCNYWSDKATLLRPYPQCAIVPACSQSCDYSRRLLAKEIARRIFNNVRDTTDVSKFDAITHSFKAYVIKYLNGHEYSKELEECVAVHYWRRVRYESKILIKDETMERMISKSVEYGRN